MRCGNVVGMERMNAFCLHKPCWFLASSALVLQGQYSTCKPIKFKLCSVSGCIELVVYERRTEGKGTETKGIQDECCDIPMTSRVHQDYDAIWYVVILHYENENAVVSNSKSGE